MARAFISVFGPLGFHYVTLDLEGCRQGSLNEACDRAEVVQSTRMGGQNESE